jgi:hypothetical protein
MRACAICTVCSSTLRIRSSGFRPCRIWSMMGLIIGVARPRWYSMSLPLVDERSPRYVSQSACTVPSSLMSTPLPHCIARPVSTVTASKLMAR